MSDRMNSYKFLDNMKCIQGSILIFINDEENLEEHFQNLLNIFNSSSICHDQYELLSLLHLILNIGNNHHRSPDFFRKLERILDYFKEKIKYFFTNCEIFNIFKSNKRILLYLIEEKVLTFDKYIAKKITTTDKYVDAKYPQYFQPEIQPFMDEIWFPKYDKNDSCLSFNEWVEEIQKDLPSGFYENRKIGENDSLVCRLIRKDRIKTLKTKKLLSIHKDFCKSIYETNSFLLKYEFRISLIQYAAFCGSIQTFKHLHNLGAELTQSLWPFAIHGRKTEIIQYLIDNNVEPKDKSFLQIFHESIKCHHNSIANLIKKMLKNEENSAINQCLKYYNFAFIEEDHINKSSFFALCKYDHCAFVDILLKNNEIDVNEKEIFYI